MAHSFDVTQADFQQQVIEASHQQPVLVDFWAQWCGPCKMLMPLLARLAEAYQGGFLLAKVDTDAEQALATHYQIRSIPTVKLFKNGQVVEEFMGVQSETQIRALLDKHVQRASDQQIAVALAVYQQGEADRALSILAEAAQSDPGNHRVSVAIARMFTDIGAYDQAKQTLDALPYDMRQSDEVKEMLARLEFAVAAQDAPDADTLLQRIAENDKDCAARFQLATIYTQQGDYQAAMEQLLEIMSVDRHFQDDAARKSMLKIFELLGGSGPLVSRYRSRMSKLLF